jgi:hypothetical protein
VEIPARPSRDCPPAAKLILAAAIGIVLTIPAKDRKPGIQLAQLMVEQKLVHVHSAGAFMFEDAASGSAVAPLLRRGGQS